MKDDYTNNSHSSIIHFSPLKLVGIVCLQYILYDSNQRLPSLLFVGFYFFQESAMTAKVRLHGDLFNKSQHHPSFLPVEKTADVLNVTFSFDLINIVSVVSKKPFYLQSNFAS